MDLSITKRFIYLLALGIILLPLGMYLGVTILLFTLYNLVCIGLLLVDLWISPTPDAIEVEAKETENLSIYEREGIQFYVHNKSPYPLKIQLKDEIPDFHFSAEKKVMEGILPPLEKKSFTYDLVATKRGAFSFENLYLKYEGRLGFCCRYSKQPLKREYKVYPNLKNLRKYKLSMVNNRLLKEGQRSIKNVGRGTSFESLREYVEGDEFRKINWKATARGNKLIVNQYQPEKNQQVYLLIDIGRPMSYTIRGNRKLDLVINTVLVLSDLINQEGDRSGLLLFNTEVRDFTLPGKGPDHRTKILETLYHVHPTNQTSNYVEAFQYLKKRERNRSIIFLFTDFSTLEEAEDLMKVIPMISKNNIVVVMLIENEGIKEIVHQKVKDKEGVFNKGVAMEYMEERKKIISLLNRRGIFCVESVAENLEYAAVNKYIEIKGNTFM